MVLLAAATLAQAQTYRSTDDKGRVQFGDTPPKGAKPAAGAPREAAAEAEPAQQQTPYEVQRAQKDFPVTVFSAPICKEPCDQARAALNKRGVPFTDAPHVVHSDEGHELWMCFFNDPDGNSWGGQQIKARGERPLIPVEYRRPFGSEQQG